MIPVSVVNKFAGIVKENIKYHIESESIVVDDRKSSGPMNSNIKIWDGLLDSGLVVFSKNKYNLSIDGYEIDLKAVPLSVGYLSELKFKHAILDQIKKQGMIDIQIHYLDPEWQQRSITIKNVVNIKTPAKLDQVDPRNRCDFIIFKKSGKKVHISLKKPTFGHWNSLGLLWYYKGEVPKKGTHDVLTFREKDVAVFGGYSEDHPNQKRICRVDMVIIGDFENPANLIEMEGKLLVKSNAVIRDMSDVSAYNLDPVLRIRTEIGRLNDIKISANPKKRLRKKPIVNKQ